MWRADAVAPGGAGAKATALPPSALYASLYGHERRVRCLDFSHDGKLLLSLGGDDFTTAFVRDWRRMAVIARASAGKLQWDAPVFSFRFNPYQAYALPDAEKEGGPKPGQAPTLDHACYSLVSCSARQLKFWTLLRLRPEVEETIEERNHIPGVKRHVPPCEWVLEGNVAKFGARGEVRARARARRARARARRARAARSARRPHTPSSAGDEADGTPSAPFGLSRSSDRSACSASTLSTTRRAPPRPGGTSRPSAAATPGRSASRVVAGTAKGDMCVSPAAAALVGMRLRPPPPAPPRAALLRLAGTSSTRSACLRRRRRARRACRRGGSPRAGAAPRRREGRQGPGGGGAAFCHYLWDSVGTLVDSVPHSADAGTRHVLTKHEREKGLECAPRARARARARARERRGGGCRGRRGG